MNSDDLDDRVRRAGTPEPAAVERVVRAALGSQGHGIGATTEDTQAIRVHAWPREFTALGTCLAVVVLAAVWWTARVPVAVPAGVYRIDAVPATTAAAAESASPTAQAAGVYRVTASPSVAPSRIMRVTTDDGTTWILSTDANDEWLPPGSGIVLSGGAAR
jgi:hypothetical protein